jgi:hypothetical protein
MTFHAWPPGGQLVLGWAVGWALAQRQPPPPPPPASAPAPVAAPGRSGAEILGRPGIRTRYADPSGPAPSPGGEGLPTVKPAERPLIVPINESVDFAPSMEEGPYQRPTIRGLFRLDLE